MSSTRKQSCEALLQPEVEEHVFAGFLVFGDKYIIKRFAMIYFAFGFFGEVPFPHVTYYQWVGDPAYILLSFEFSVDFGQGLVGVFKFLLIETFVVFEGGGIVVFEGVEVFVYLQHIMLHNVFD